MVCLASQSKCLEPGGECRIGHFLESQPPAGFLTWARWVGITECWCGTREAILGGCFADVAGRPECVRFDARNVSERSGETLFAAAPAKTGAHGGDRATGDLTAAPLVSRTDETSDQDRDAPSWRTRRLTAPGEHSGGRVVPGATQSGELHPQLKVVNSLATRKVLSAPSA